MPWEGSRTAGARGLEDERLRQVAVLLHPAECRQDACIRDEHPANAEPDGAPRLGDRRVEPACPRATPPTALVVNDWPPASQAPRGPRKRETSTPCSAPATPSPRSLRRSASSRPSLRDRRTGTSRASASSRTARRTSGPSTEGISIRYLRPSAKACIAHRPIFSQSRCRPQLVDARQSSIDDRRGS